MKTNKFLMSALAAAMVIAGFRADRLPRPTLTPKA